MADEAVGVYRIINDAIVRAEIALNSPQVQFLHPFVNSCT
jgi:hypothetical protein